MACIRVERVENGYTVTATDPKIQEANRKSDNGPGYKWRDPDREYVFKTCAEATAFIEKIADKALPLDPGPPDPFASAFAEAVANGDTEEDGED